MDNGWDASAAAWIASMGEAGETGDFGRQHILDAPMLARVRGRGFHRALDVGCGEGRFCRKLAALGMTTVGIDPTEPLIAAARERDPVGRYEVATAEALPFAAAHFDLVVSYLSLIDIADVTAAIAEMARVLAPGGTLLIANLNGFHTAIDAARSVLDRTRPTPRGQGYLDEQVSWQAWHGIRIQNWHRPLSRYMSLLLDHGLTLSHFDEPAPTGGDPAKAARYRTWPYYLIMEWQKPLVPSLTPPPPP